MIHRYFRVALLRRITWRMTVCLLSDQLTLSFARVSHTANNNDDVKASLSRKEPHGLYPPPKKKVNQRNHLDASNNESTTINYCTIQVTQSLDPFQ